MSYVKQTWATGDVITAEKLNHMEDGIEEGVANPLLVVFTYDESIEGNKSNKTYSEIVNAIENNMTVIGVESHLSGISSASYIDIFPNTPLVFDFISISYNDSDQPILVRERIEIASDDTITTSKEKFNLSSAT